MSASNPSSSSGSVSSSATDRAFQSLQQVGTQGVVGFFAGSFLGLVKLATQASEPAPAAPEPPSGLRRPLGVIPRAQVISAANVDLAAASCFRTGVHCGIISVIVMGMAEISKYAPVVHPAVLQGLGGALAGAYGSVVFQNEPVFHLKHMARKAGLMAVASIALFQASDYMNRSEQQQQQTDKQSRRQK